MRTSRLSPSTSPKSNASLSKEPTSNTASRLALPDQLLPACDEAIGSEDPQVTKVSFERAAAGAVRAGVRPPFEERVGSEGEDVVDTRGEVVREVEQRADTPPHCFGSVHGPQPDGPVVDELDAGRERPAVGRSRQHQDRARRRRGAGALRAAGEDVGVAF